MGLLSSIGKVVKNVWKGVKKVFSKVVNWFGKVAGSKWGKVIMIAAAIYTGGAALAAGWSQAAATSGSFMTKFVAGSKAFMGALTGTSAAAGAGETAAAGVTGTVQGATGAGGMGNVATGAAGAAEAAGAAGSASGVTGGAAGAAEAAKAAEAFRSTGVLGKAATATAEGASALSPTIVKGAQAVGNAGGWGAKAGGMLKTAAKGAWDMANSPIGKEVISKGLEGYMEGKRQEEEWEREDKRLYGNKRERKEAGEWGNRAMSGQFSYDQQY